MEGEGFLRLRRFSPLTSRRGERPVTLPDRTVWWPAAIQPVDDGVAVAWIPVDGESVHVVRLASDLSIAATVEIPVDPRSDRAIGIPSLAVRDARLALAWLQTRDAVGQHVELALIDGTTVAVRGRWEPSVIPSPADMCRIAIQEVGAFGWAALWATSTGSTLFARFSDEDLLAIGPPPAELAAEPCGQHGLAMAWNGDVLAIACNDSPSLRVFVWGCRATSR